MFGLAGRSLRRASLLRSPPPPSMVSLKPHDWGAAVPVTLRTFEDFHVGDELPLASCRVAREAIVAFAEEYDPQPLHLDEDAAADSLVGGLCASGWHTCALFMRMMVDGWLGASASMGSPGIETLTWRQPVRPGDELSGASTVISVRPSRRRPGMGLVTFRHEVRNQAGEVVMESVNPIMFARREAAR
jgi:acyl dehydratase